MPKNTVNDPITDQEIAFAHLVLSGTMDDRRAAEAIGLNPDTAAYLKSKPRVRAYMIEHRAAVEDRLVDREAEGLRNLNIGRDQILARLWELAKMDPETTRGSMTGQIKALAMIIAIEGLVSAPMKAGRLAATATPPPAAPVSRANIVTPEWLGQGQPQAAGPLPGKSSAANGPSAGPANHIPSPYLDESQPKVFNPFVHAEASSSHPAATAAHFDLAFDAVASARLPFSPPKGFPGRRH
jgi:hypothetical protein